MVSYVFPPMAAGGSVRLSQFAKYLPSYDWDVTVLTSGSPPEADEQGEAEVVRIASKVSSMSTRGRGATSKHDKAAMKALKAAARFVLFPDRHLMWALRAVRTASSLGKDFDVVFASYGPPSSIIAGSLIAKRLGLPLVVDFRDLWADLPLDVFASPAHRRAAIAIERAICRQARRIIGVSPRMASYLAERHNVPASRSVSIPNGFDPADQALAVDRRDPDGRGGPFVMTYTGSVTIHYNLEPFWTALARLAARGVLSPATFRLRFVGNMSMEEPARYGLEEFVETQPYVPHDQVFDVLGVADALLMIETPGYYKTFSYAAKLFDYLLTGKPVLGLVEEDSHSHALLTRAGVGTCADPEDSAAIEEALQNLVLSPRQPAKKVDVDGQPLSDFNRVNLTQRLAAALSDAAEPARGF